MPDIAIVILNWNGLSFLQQFLPSVLAHSPAYCRVCMADNASTDQSVAYVQERFPAVEIIRLQRNLGFAKGYNEALKQVKADYYVLLNSDVEVSAGWIEPVIDLMETDKTIGACQPKILMHSDRKHFEYAGAAGGWLDYLGYPFARGRVFDVCEEDNGQYDTVENVFWASGAAMFIRSELYHQMGGLDEYFFAHQEEIDLCWRLQLSGYLIKVCPASVVYHVGGGTLPKGNERKVYLNFRNNLIMLWKNLPASQKWWKIPFRIALDALSAWKSVFSGQGIYFIAIVKAHGSFVHWLLFKKKQSVWPAARKGTLHGWFTGAIVWQYFVKRRTKFSEIVGNKNG